MKLKLTIEYDGSSFCGWQWQEGLKTIQEELERSLLVLINSEAKKKDLLIDYRPVLRASGRTDSGVHAQGQVVSLSVPDELDLDPFRMKAALNGICDPEISILKIEQVADDFDARFTPHIKQYSYKILLRHGHDSLSKGRVWRLPDKLDIKAMVEAAKYYVGQFDYTSFAALDCESKTKIRTINLSELARIDNNFLIYTVQGKGFLKQQVRIMLGTLVEVGKGKIKPQDISNIIAAQNRRLAGETAPACGLYLDWVRYEKAISSIALA